MNAYERLEQFQAGLENDKRHYAAAADSLIRAAASAGTNHPEMTREEFEPLRAILAAGYQLATDGKNPRGRPRKHDWYDMFCAILFREQNAISWRNLPDRFPPWRTVHETHLQWSLRRGDDGLPVLGKAMASLANNRLAQGA